MIAKDVLKFENWAVVGDVLNPAKYAYEIVEKLKEHNKTIYKVNPKGDGEEVYKSLLDIKEPVDIIVLVINPVDGFEYLKEIKEMDIKVLFIQPGASSPEIIDFCNKNSIRFLRGCILVEYRLAGI